MATPRPTQATIAGGMVIAGSVVAVVAAFAAVPHLSLPGTSHETDEILRVAAIVSAACAAAAGVLGWYALQRSKGARLALTVLAVPLFVADLAVNDVAGALVAAAATMLWLQPARAWFDGVEPPPRPALTAPRPPASGPNPPGWPAPPATYDRDALLRLPPPTSPPLGAAPPPLAPAGASPAGRPTAVVWACVLTWGVAVFALAVFGEGLVSMLTDTQRVLDQAHRQNPDLASQGISDTTLKVAIYLTTGIGVAWALAAASFALLAWRRVRWAAIGLLVSTVLVGGLGLLMVRSEVRRWYAGQAG